jgi:hypothetical protein
MFLEIKNIKHSIVSNNPDWYEGFPDVEINTEGTYVCVFRRSLGHIGKNHTLMMATSKDGNVWSQPAIFQLPRDEEEGDLWNCPRIQRFPDGHLEVMCDFHDMFRLQEEPGIFTWKTNKSGQNWIGPMIHPCYGVMPDKVLINPEHPTEQILGVHYRDPNGEKSKHVIYRSMDSGENWWSEEVMKAKGVHDYREASLVLVPGTKNILAFIRDDIRIGGKGAPIRLTVSYDFGKTWGKLLELPLWGHRPIAKFLKDGRLMITYREVGGELCTALWVGNLDQEKLTPHHRNKFDELFTNQKFYSIDSEDTGTNFADYGFSGFVQNPDTDEIVVVYYTRKGEKDCYIKSATIDPLNL